MIFISVNEIENTELGNILKRESDYERKIKRGIWEIEEKEEQEREREEGIKRERKW